jgi:hypothetical protein
MAHYQNEPNIMGYLFKDNSKVAEIVSDSREAFRNGKKIKFFQSEIFQARDEVNSLKKSMDEQTFPLTQHLNEHVFNGDSRRSYIIIEGKLYSDRSHHIDTQIIYDLGVNSSRFFRQDPGSDTIDSMLTRDFAELYIMDKKEKLKKIGYDRLEIERSRFFYFRDSGLDPFRDDSGIVDISKLMPLVCSNQGYIFTEKVSDLNQTKYNEIYLPHVSARLKKSLLRKVMNKIRIDRQLDDSDKISDLGANRIVVPTLEEAIKLNEFFEGNPILTSGKPGRGLKSAFLHAATQDRYKDPKEAGNSEYKAFIEVLRIKTGKNNNYREIQIVDSEQYRKNELVKGATDHTQMEKRDSNVPKKIRDLDDHYTKLLRRIFGVQNVSININ